MAVANLKIMVVSMLTIFAAVYATWTIGKQRPVWDANPDLCDAKAVLYQLSYQANWELVIVWGYDKPNRQRMYVM